MHNLNKTCNTCGKKHDSVPAVARPWVESEKPKLILGFFWECACGSTMFKRTIELDELKKSLSQPSTPL